MKHPSTRALLAYWDNRRGARPAPDRAEINPGDIRHQLGDTFILATDIAGRLRFRLAGTKVCALFGREIKGEVFGALWDAPSRAALETLTTIVTQEQVGTVAGLTGHTDDGALLNLEMLLLPLTDRGHARVRALGLLAPLAPPYWLGATPVTALTLGTIHYLGHDPDRARHHAQEHAHDHDHAASQQFRLPPAQSALPAALPELWRNRWQKRWQKIVARQTAAPAATPLSDRDRTRHGLVVYHGGRPIPPATDRASGRLTKP